MSPDSDSAFFGLQLGIGLMTSLAIAMIAGWPNLVSRRVVPVASEENWQAIQGRETIELVIADSGSSLAFGKC